MSTEVKNQKRFLTDSTTIVTGYAIVFVQREWQGTGRPYYNRQPNTVS